MRTTQITHTIRCDGEAVDCKESVTMPSGDIHMYPDGWYTLSKRTYAKPVEEHHFCSLHCLAWFATMNNHA